jgi:hypothetical protein
VATGPGLRWSRDCSSSLGFLKHVLPHECEGVLKGERGDTEPKRGHPVMTRKPQPVAMEQLCSERWSFGRGCFAHALIDDEDISAGRVGESLQM